MKTQKFERYWAKLGIAHALLLAIGLPAVVIGLALHSYYHIHASEKYKCFKYINNEHYEYPLFDDLNDLKKYFHSNPDICTNRIEIEEVENVIVKKGSIVVKLLDEKTDSPFVKVQYRKLLFWKEFFTLKCFVNEYSPEDFTFEP